jgi:hypothetical protein
LFNGAFYKWDFDENKWIAASAAVYAYIDYMTGISYEWNQTANEWQATSKLPDLPASTTTCKQTFILSYF